MARPSQETRGLLKRPSQEALWRGIQRQRAPHLQPMLQLAYARMDACAATSMRVCRKTLDAYAATSVRVCNHALQLACAYDNKTLGAPLVAAILVTSAPILVASAAKTLTACRLHSRRTHTYAHTYQNTMGNGRHRVSYSGARATKRRVPASKREDQRGACLRPNPPLSRVPQSMRLYAKEARACVPTHPLAALLDLS